MQNNTTLIVTGGCGFIGSRFILKALSLGYTIINVDKLTYAADESLNSLFLSSGDYKFRNVDICETKNLIKIFEEFNPSSVIHFAAESHVDNSIVGPSDFINTNIIGTFSLLEAIRSYTHSSVNPNEIRLLHISTDEVYGSLGLTGQFHEESPYSPNSPYSASKAASDLLVNAWSKTYGLNTVVTNCSNNYGPHQNSEKLIPKIILNAFNNLVIPIYGDGSNVRDWLFVDDHVNALLKILKNTSENKRYNIGGGYEISNLELAKLICEIIDEKYPGTIKRNELIKFVDDRKGHDFRYSIDNSKIRSDLNWEPNTNFIQGLVETIKWYREKYYGSDR